MAKQICPFVHRVLDDIAKGLHSEPNMFAGQIIGLSRYDVHGDEVWTIRESMGFLFSSIKAFRGERRGKSQEVQLNRYEKRLLSKALYQVEGLHKAKVKQAKLDARN